MSAIKQGKVFWMMIWFKKIRLKSCIQKLLLWERISNLNLSIYNICLLVKFYWKMLKIIYPLYNFWKNSEWKSICQNYDLIFVLRWLWRNRFIAGYKLFLAGNPSKLFIFILNATFAWSFVETFIVAPNIEF